MKTKTESFLQKGEIVSYTSGTKEAAEKGKPAHNLKKVALKLGIVTLAFSMALTGCSKSEAGNNQQQTTQNQVHQITKEEFTAGYTKSIDIFYLEALYDVLQTSKEMKEYVDKGEKVPTKLSLQLLEQTDICHDVIPPKEWNQLKEEYYDAQTGYDYDAFGEAAKKLMIQKMYEKDEDVKVVSSSSYSNKMIQETKQNIRQA